MINSDLDCVMVEEVSRASSAMNRKRLELRSRSEAIDPGNPRQKTEKTQLEKISHVHSGASKLERVKFGKIKRGFKSAIDVVSANNSDAS